MTNFQALQELTAADLNAAFADDAVKLMDAVNISATGGLYTTSGTTELDIGRLAHTSIAIDASRLYRTDVQMITTRTVASDEFELRIRQGTAVSGTLLASRPAYAAPTTNGHLVKVSLLWVPASSTTTTVFLSIVRATGTGTLSVFGSTTLGRSQSVLSQLGPATRFRTITV